MDETLNYCHVNFGYPSRLASTIFDEERDLVDMIEQGHDLEDVKSKDWGLCKYKSIFSSSCPVYRVDGKDSQCSIYQDLQQRDVVLDEGISLLDN